MFEKVLVANRGEIAVRVIRACRELGLASVAVFSDADEHALHVRHADEAVYIGPPPARKSYLNVAASSKPRRRRAPMRSIPATASWPRTPASRRRAGSRAIFVGPSAEAIERMGDKAAARQLAGEAECPTVPGAEESASARRGARRRRRSATRS